MDISPDPPGTRISSPGTLPPAPGNGKQVHRVVTGHQSRYFFFHSIDSQAPLEADSSCLEIDEAQGKLTGAAFPLHGAVIQARIDRD